jgi:hypothetical protein
MLYIPTRESLLFNNQVGTELWGSHFSVLSISDFRLPTRMLTVVRLGSVDDPAD